MRHRLCRPADPQPGAPTGQGLDVLMQIQDQHALLRQEENPTTVDLDITAAGADWLRGTTGKAL
ncbi:MAG: hypothetical protein R2932_43690 [Caldilineaceae bacterium]